MAADGNNQKRLNTRPGTGSFFRVDRKPVGKRLALLAAAAAVIAACAWGVGLYRVNQAKQKAAAIAGRITVSREFPYKIQAADKEEGLDTFCKIVKWQDEKNDELSRLYGIYDTDDVYGSGAAYKELTVSRGLKDDAYILYSDAEYNAALDAFYESDEGTEAVLKKFFEIEEGRTELPQQHVYNELWRDGFDTLESIIKGVESGAGRWIVSRCAMELREDNGFPLYFAAVLDYELVGDGIAKIINNPDSRKELTAAVDCCNFFDFDIKEDIREQALNKVKRKEAAAESAASKKAGSAQKSSTQTGSYHYYGSSSSKRHIDPDDYDIEGYYDDYSDIYDSYEDAYEGFLEDESVWDDY